MFRDKVRWIRSWYLGRTRPGTREGYPGPYPQNARFRSEAAGDAAKDLASGGGGAGTVAGGGSSNAPAQAMDVDYGSPNQLTMPGELDEAFWQAMFAMSGSGMDWMDVQA